jgi:hypothetical protein
MPITTNYGNITGDTDYSFLTGGYDITPWYHVNLKSDDKAFLKFTLTTEGCDSTNYVTVYYQTYYTSLTGTWTKLGVFDESPNKTISLKSSIPTGSMIRFKREITTSATTTTPKITGMDCRGIWRPAKRKMIKMTALVKDRPVLRNSISGDETAKSLAEAIEEQNDNTKPTTFYDIDGTELTVSFITAIKGNVKTPKDKNPEYTYTILLEVL